MKAEGKPLLPAADENIKEFLGEFHKEDETADTVKGLKVETMAKRRGSPRVEVQRRVPAESSPQPLGREAADSGAVLKDMPQVTGGKTTVRELTQRLETHSGAEIVKQVKLILEKTDAGEIRLNLHPPELGRVRIRVRMEENRLSGRIFVESMAAKDAFRAALGSLETRLEESGFFSVDLGLSMEGGDFAFSDENSPGDFEQAAREFGHSVPIINEYWHSDNRVNLMV